MSSDTPRTDEVLNTVVDAPYARDVKFDMLRDHARQLEAELAEAIKIARIAIGGLQAVYGHAQHCDHCQSFEIAKQHIDELHGFNRIDELEEGGSDE